MKTLLGRTGEVLARFKLFRDYAVLAGGQVGAKILGFVAFAWLARVLDPASYGGLEYVVGLAALFAAIVDGGIGAIGVRRIAKHPESLPKLAFQAPVARLMIAAICVPLMALLATQAMGDVVPAGLIWLFAASLLLAPWRQEWLMQATERMGATAMAQVIRSGVFVAGVLLLVRSPGELVLVGWMEVAAVAAMVAYCVFVQHRVITPFRLRGDLGGFAGLIKEGAEVSSTNLVWAAIQSLPLIIIGALAGAVELALFAAAARLTGSVVQFSNLYHFNLYPAVARAAASDREAMAVLMRASFRSAAWGGVFIALGVTLFATEAMRILFGDKLAGSGPILAVMIWTLPIALCSGHARWGLTALGEQRKVLVAHLAGLVLLAGLCTVLGRAMGGVGYAIGAAAGPFGIWLVAHVYAARAGNQPPPFRIAAVPFGLAALAALAAYRFDLGLPARVAILMGFALAAPVIDRRLIGDALRLGQAKRAA